MCTSHDCNLMFKKFSLSLSYWFCCDWKFSWGIFQYEAFLLLLVSSIAGIIRKLYLSKKKIIRKLSSSISVTLCIINSQDN
jgi:hypothetical protein